MLTVNMTNGSHRALNEKGLQVKGLNSLCVQELFNQSFLGQASKDISLLKQVASIHQVTRSHQ